MECNGSFITVANASISVVICQVPNDKFLPDVNDLVNVFSGKVDQLNGKLTWTNTEHFTFLVKAESCNCTAVVADLHVNFALSHGFYLENAEIGVIRHA